MEKKSIKKQQKALSIEDFQGLKGSDQSVVVFQNRKLSVKKGGSKKGSGTASTSESRALFKRCLTKKVGADIANKVFSEEKARSEKALTLGEVRSTLTSVKQINTELSGDVSDLGSLPLGIIADYVGEGKRVETLTDLVVGETGLFLGEDLNFGLAIEDRHISDEDISNWIEKGRVGSESRIKSLKGIDDTRITKVGFLKLLECGALRKLEELDLTRCSWVDEEVLTKLANPQYGALHLKKLYVERVNNDSDFSFFNNFTKLEELSIRGKRSSDFAPIEGKVADFSKLSNLKTLVMHKCPYTTGIRLHPNAVSNIMKIELNEVGINDEGLGALFSSEPGFKSLEELSLEHCANIRNLSALGSLTHLKKLNLYDLQLEEADEGFIEGNLTRASYGLEELAKLKELEELSIKSCPIKYINGIGLLSNLRKLKLYDLPVKNNLGIDGLERLKKLEEVDVSMLEDLTALNFLSGSASTLKKLQVYGMKSLVSLYVKSSTASGK